KHDEFDRKIVPDASQLDHQAGGDESHQESWEDEQRALADRRREACQQPHERAPAPGIEVSSRRRQKPEGHRGNRSDSDDGDHSTPIEPEQGRTGKKPVGNGEHARKADSLNDRTEFDERAPLVEAPDLRRDEPLPGKDPDQDDGDWRQHSQQYGEDAAAIERARPNTSGKSKEMGSDHRQKDLSRRYHRARRQSNRKATTWKPQICQEQKDV